MIEVAALFVQTNGAYFGLPFVDPWDEHRDARKYRAASRCSPSALLALVQAARQGQPDPLWAQDRR